MFDVLSRLSALALTVGIVATSGCATIHIDLPDDFLVVRDEENDLRAMTADEARVWVRTQDAPSGADLVFWKKSLTRDLVEGRGYTVIENNDVKDGAGNDGVELICEATVGGIPHRYLLAAFLLPTPFPFFFDDTIRTLEYVAEKDEFDTHVDGIRKSMETLR